MLGRLLTILVIVILLAVIGYVNYRQSMRTAGKWIDNISKPKK